MITDAIYAQLADAAYQDNPANMQLPSGWTFLRPSDPNQAGYQGYAFARLDAAGHPVEIVIASRGTEPLTFDGDWTANLQMGANQLPDQYQFAKQFLDQVLNDPLNTGTSITLTGHSLGGALTQLLAAETGLTATTFNAYGAQDLLPLIPSNDRIAAGDFSNITNHRTLLDPVSILPGSNQLGAMHTHVAPSEMAVWPLVIAIGKLPAAVAGGSIWSHGMGRFGEIYFDPAKAIIDAGLMIGNTINGIEQAVANTFNAAQAFIQRFGDPLTLDLNGDGIETVPLKTPPLLFDINASGIKIGTGWIAPGDGLLVLDRNGNGMVDSGAELFGDATPAYGAGTATPDPTGKRTADGFAALSQEDTNADGAVNALDANFAALQVWQDLNQDGISQPDELTSLADAGIASFDTARTQHSQLLPSGNQMADMGTYTRADGSAGATGAPQGMADINLALDTFHRSFADTIPPTAAALALPDMQGSGKVRDLREAASLQTAAGQALSAALGNYDSAATREDQLAQIDALIGAWAATAGFGTLQSRAAARGYTFTLGLDAVHQSHLAALEAFNGRGYFKMPWEGASFGESARQGLTVGWGGNPKAMYGALWGQAGLLDQAYAALKESVYRALLPQTRLKPYLDAIGLTLDAEGNFSLDTGYREAANDGWYTDRRAA